MQEFYISSSSIKIFSDDLCCFFSANGISPSVVRIVKEQPEYSEARLLGNFLVKDKAWISKSDSENVGIYEFDRGLYLVYFNDSAVYIYKHAEVEKWSKSTEIGSKVAMT